MSRRSKLPLQVLACLTVVGLGNPARADFLVSVGNNTGTRNEVLRYTDTGTFVGVFASGNGLSTPEGLAYGPDGNLYVASFANGGIYEFDGTTGAFIKVLASSASMTNSVTGLAFGPNGNVYVSNYNTSANAVQEFNGSTGALVASFNIAAGSGGLSGPLHISFDAGGNLLVSSSGSNQVLKYDSATGAFLSTLVAAGSGGLNFPDGKAFFQGNLLVSSSFSSQVLAYNATTGAFISSFANLSAQSSPVGLLATAGNHLLVAENNSGSILDYDKNGNLVGTYGLAQMGGASTPGYPTYMTSFLGVPEPPALVLSAIGTAFIGGFAFRARRRGV